MKTSSNTWLQGLVLASCLLPAVSSLGNCESGAYRIHTVAEYAALDEARTWIFRGQLVGDRLEIQPSASTSEGSVQRLVAFLRGPHREQSVVRRGETTCHRVPGESVELFRKAEAMDRWTASLPLCPELAVPGDELRRFPVLFDRDTKTIVLPTPLAVSAPKRASESTTPEEGGTPRERWEPRLERLDLRASDAAAASRITNDDIASLAELRIGLGDPANGFALVILALRLHHLETLLPADGYLDPAKIARGQAEFPVLFLDSGGEEEPLYIGDGRWCSSYRLSLEMQATRGPFLGSLERFSVTGAFDTDRDGRPDLLRVNDQVVYRLGGENGLEVVDWGQGC